MKVLIKSHAYDGVSSLVIVTDPKKEKEIRRLLTVSRYACAVKYLLSFADEMEQLQIEQPETVEIVDFVLTPKSVHWDLVR